MRINPASNDTAPEVHCGALVESWALRRRSLRWWSEHTRFGPGTHQFYAADEEIPVGIDVQRAQRRGIGNIDRIHPGESAVGRSSELSAAVIVAVAAPGLVLESMSRAVGVVDRKPLFIAAIRRCDIRPRLTAIE